MSEWWTYKLSSFLLFSPRVYDRLFELHNRALWPAHILTLLLGLAILPMWVRPIRAGHRLIPAILGGLWIAIAWAFLWERYATINWPVAYVAPLFVLQGLLLIWIGAVKGHLTFAAGRGPIDFFGPALFAFCLAGYPLLAPLMGRSWFAAEVFGIAPDPTVLATVVALAFANGRGRWLLLIVPVLWCVIAGATLWAMKAGDYFILPACALAFGFASILRRR